MFFYYNISKISILKGWGYDFVLYIIIFVNYVINIYMYIVIIRCEIDFIISINLFKVCYYYFVFLYFDVYIIKSIYLLIENCYFFWLKFFIERY